MYLIQGYEHGNGCLGRGVLEVMMLCGILTNYKKTGEGERGEGGRSRAARAICREGKGRSFLLNLMQNLDFLGS